MSDTKKFPGDEPGARLSRALAECESKYRTLIERAPEAVVIFDVDRHHFVEVNQKACNLFGLSREELLTSDPIALSPPIQPNGRSSEAAAWDYLRAALAGETPSFEWIHRTSQGADVPCEVQLARMPSTNSRLVRGCVADITPRKKLEQQLRQWQKLDALGKFAGGIAHDFNNVLTLILASAELLATELTDEVQQADVRAIITATRKGAALTAHLLAFARGQPAAPPGVVDLNEIVRDIAIIMKRVLGDDIALILELDDAGAPARIDRSEAEQVTMNLLLNARDAIAGAGTIRICTQRGQHGSHFTLLQVKDTGAGIAPEVKCRMFEPFFTTKTGKGTGLGLSTVCGIVAQAGGTIGVDSTVGVGTTMDVLLPGE